MVNIKITKANGENVFFDKKKLISSLRKAGAPAELSASIANNVEQSLFEGMSTREIYKKAFSQLRKTSYATASRYKLKKAIFELGDTGFPFEKLVGKILAEEGYETKVGVILQGSCVKHEIDVVAQKENYQYIIECKFHSQQGRISNVKTPLYINSRFLDVEHNLKNKKKNKLKVYQGGVYTNTRFSLDALQYGECAGLLMISWDHPKGNGLKDRIDKSGLHPLTSLNSLTKAEKNKLLDTGIVLCKELHEHQQLLDEIGVSKIRQKKILKQSYELCQKNNYK
jgi:hypothetical protein